MQISSQFDKYDSMELNQTYSATTQASKFKQLCNAVVNKG